MHKDWTYTANTGIRSSAILKYLGKNGVSDGSNTVVYPRADIFRAWNFDNVSSLLGD